MDGKEIIQISSDLDVQEKEAVLRALGFYQIRLFDEMKENPETSSTKAIESQRVTSAIKKIHKSIEAKKK
jgi:hypothetical protein